MRAAGLVAVLMLGACAAPAAAPSAPAPVPAPAPQATAAVAAASSYVELTNPANGTRIALKRGGELKLVLDADPLHNLQWEAGSNLAPVLVPIGQRVFVGKSENPMDYKAGAWNVFRFRGEQTGNVTLKFDLRPFGETGPATRAVQYDVAVE